MSTKETLLWICAVVVFFLVAATAAHHITNHRHRNDPPHWNGCNNPTCHCEPVCKCKTCKCGGHH